jgi:hypothetical protein
MLRWKRIITAKKRQKSIPLQYTMTILLLSWIGVLIGLQGCAHIEPPPGGPEDKTPLQITGVYPIPGSTNVSTELRAVASFSHWVSTPIQDQQVILNPAIPRKLQFKESGNRLGIASESTLEENTTYSLFFRKGGLQGTHKKPLYNSYVLPFSTGPSVDTTSLKAQVFSLGKGFSSKSSPVYLGLYLQGLSRKNKSYLREPFVQSRLVETGVEIEVEHPDSIPSMTAERPYYVIPFDTTGTLDFSWVQPGEYGVVVFEDKNNNLRPDLGSEEMGIGPFYHRVTKKGVENPNPITLRIAKLDTTWLQVKQTLWKPVDKSKGEIHITLNQPILENVFSKNFFRVITQGESLERDSGSITSTYKEPTIQDAYLLPNHETIVLTLKGWEQEYFYGLKISGLIPKKRTQLDTNLAYFQTMAPKLEDTVTTESTVIKASRQPLWKPYNFKWKENNKEVDQWFYFSTDTLVDFGVDSLKKTWKLYVDSQEVAVEWKNMGHYYFALRISGNTPLELLNQAKKLEWKRSIFIENVSDASQEDTLKGEWREQVLGAVSFKNKDTFGKIQLFQSVVSYREEFSRWIYVIGPKQNSETNNGKTLSLEQIIRIQDPSPIELLPGEYVLYGFEDTDGNGIWSEGSVYPWAAQESFYEVMPSITIEEKEFSKIDLSDFFRKLQRGKRN